jgi:hypothetical protein
MKTVFFCGFIFCFLPDSIINDNHSRRTSLRGHEAKGESKSKAIRVTGREGL